MARRKAWNSYALGVIGAIHCLKRLKNNTDPGGIHHSPSLRLGGSVKAGGPWRWSFRSYKDAWGRMYVLQKSKIRQKFLTAGPAPPGGRKIIAQ
jgi:hypothetical protein